MSLEQFVDITMRLSKDIFQKIQEQGYAEIVTRGYRKQYLPFTKAQFVQNAPDSEIANALTKLLNNTSSIGQTVSQYSNQLSTIAVQGKLGISLSAANLVVNAAGIIIIKNSINALGHTIDKMDSKLDKLDAKANNDLIQEYQEIALQFCNLTSLITGLHSVDLKDSMNWLSHAQPYMNKLINNIMNNVVDKGIALDMIYTLLSAYTAVVILMMREYRFSTGICFGAMDEYFSLYRQLMSPQFIDEVTFYYFAEKNMHIREVMESVQSKKQIVCEEMIHVQDEMKLLEVIDNKKDYIAYERAMKEAAIVDIKSYLSKVGNQTGVTNDVIENMLEQTIAAM